MTVGVLTQLQASFFFLLPVAIVLICVCGRQATRLQEVTLWIPATLAFDVLTCLLLARAVTLDVAFLLSRALWAIGAAVWIRRNRDRLAWPAALGRQELAIIVISGLVTFLASVVITRNFSIWDRQLHIPVVTAIRGQRLPFLTVFQPNTILHYHFFGDVVSAGLQVFSGVRIHGSLALALAHDLMFGLVGVSVAASLASTTARKAWILPAVCSVFLMGPFALFRYNLGPQNIGYSIINILCISFRPHVSVAILLLTGVFAAVELRLDGRTPPSRTLFGLVCTMAALAITDESSVAIAGLALAGTWLILPQILHPRRRVGALVLLGILVAIVLVNLIFQASLAPGGPVQGIKVVPWRSPGYIKGPLPLLTLDGLYAMVTDLAPFLMILVTLGAAALRDRDTGSRGVAVLLALVLLVAVVALSVIDVNGVASESHRFATICLVLFPLAGIALLPRLATGAWERLLIIGALCFSTVSTIYWSEGGMGPPEEYFTNMVDCRSSTGARLFDRPEPVYIPRPDWFAYAGCRPVFSPGLRIDWASLYTNGPVGGRNAFMTLHTAFVPRKDDLAVVCRVGDDTDPVCRHARTHGRCAPPKTSFQQCRLSWDDREALMAQTW